MRRGGRLARKIALALLFAAASLLVPADLSPFTRTASAAAADTLVVLVPADIITVDPARYFQHGLTEVVQSHIYLSLLAKDGPEYGPGIARSFDAVDALTWRFDLSDPPLLHDGTRLSASKVKAFLERSLGLEAGPSGVAPARGRFGPVEAIEAAGDELVIRLREPWPALPARFAREPVGGLDPRGGPVGSGPFRLEQWDRGNRVILTRVGETPPGGFDRIRFEVVPRAEERLRRMLAGEAHLATDLPPGAYWRLRQSRLAKPVTIPESRVHFIEFDVARPPFNDPRVRRALNMAVDSEALVRRLMQEEAVAVATLLSPVTYGYDPSVPLIGYDPVGARELLAEAGYPQGFAFELDVTSGKRSIGEVYAEMLAAVGVDVTLRVWSDWSRLREQILLGRRQAWLGEWRNSSMDPRDAIWPKLHSRGEANYGGYVDPTLDALLEMAEGLVDPGERLEVYRVIQRFLRQEPPMLFGYAQFVVYGASVLLDWRPGPEGRLALDQARRKDGEVREGP